MSGKGNKISCFTLLYDQKMTKFSKIFFQTCNTKCDELKDCVQCKVHESGPLKKEECDLKCPYNITVVDYLKGTVI